MSFQQQCESTDTNVPINLQVNRNGGVTGLTATVEIRDGSTLNSYLDFFDQTFKTIGWTTKAGALTDNGGGVYSLSGGLNVNTMSGRVGKHLVAEFNVSGAYTGDAIDIVLIQEHLYDVAIAGDSMDLVADAVDASAVATSGANEIRDSILSDSTPFAGADIGTLISRLTALRAANLDEITAARLAELDAANLPADVDTLLSRLTALRAANLDEITAARLAELDAANLPADVDTLLTRLTALRAANLDEITAARLAELDAANLPADVDTLLTRLTALRAANLDEITAARLAELDPANLPADVDTLLTRLTALRAANLDNLDAAISLVLSTGDAGPWTSSSAQDWSAGEREQFRDALGIDGTKTTAIGGQLQRALGLVQENFKLESPSYNGNGDLLQATIKIYPSAGDLAAGTNLIAEYLVAATYDGLNRLSTYQLTKV